MSNPNSPKQTPSDFSPNELEKVNNFAEAGLPGISSITEAQMNRAMGLYLAGHTYHSISRNLGVRKEIILYLAQKFDWHKMKTDYLAELNQRLSVRLVEEKLQSTDFLLQLSKYLQAKLSRQMNRDSATGNEHSEIDLKEVDRLLKVIDAISKSTQIDASQKNSPISVNVSQAAIHIQNAEGADSTSKTYSGMTLKMLADKRRQEEAAVRSKS